MTSMKPAVTVLARTLQWNGRILGSELDFGRLQKTLAQERVKLHAKLLTEYGYRGKLTE